jgi:pilus assembly protein Flp/PilA
MKEKLFGLMKDEQGQAMTEYGLIIALVAVVVIAALTAMGDSVFTKFNAITTGLGGTAATK